MLSSSCITAAVWVSACHWLSPASDPKCPLFPDPLSLIQGVTSVLLMLSLEATRSALDQSYSPPPPLPHPTLCLAQLPGDGGQSDHMTFCGLPGHLSNILHEVLFSDTCSRSRMSRVLCVPLTYSQIHELMFSDFKGKASVFPYSFICIDRKSVV